MNYEILAEFIESHKAELAIQLIKRLQAIGMSEVSQEAEETAGFAYSLGIIARYIREANPREWQVFVEGVAKNQMARGMTLEQSLNLADCMIEVIIELLEQVLADPQDEAMRNKFRARLGTLHSLGKVTIVVTQMKGLNNT